MARHVVLLAGPPCGGKTWFANQHAQPSDLVLDRDVIGEPAMQHRLAHVARSTDGNAWVIRSVPNGDERAALAIQLSADEVLVFIPTEADLYERAQQRPDPMATLAGIRRWQREYTPWSGDEVIGGAVVHRGNPEVREWVGANRDKIQRAVYSSSNVCWLCGKPVDWTADPRTKWAPSVDHVIPRALGGDPFDLANCRLAHLGCNAGRGKRLTPSRASAASRRW